MRRFQRRSGGRRRAPSRHDDSICSLAAQLGAGADGASRRRSAPKSLDGHECTCRLRQGHSDARSAILRRPLPRGEVCHAQERRPRRARPLLSGRANAARAIRPRAASSADAKLCTGTRSSRRSSGATIHARVAQVVGFKKCCMRSGSYDGSPRRYFFQRVDPGGHLTRGWSGPARKQVVAVERRSAPAAQPPGR